ncbi:MAG: DNA-formamidopyrimidine glycosylase family protein [Bacillota bacterium]
MPEIPEMEIYCDYLNKYTASKIIERVEVERSKRINGSPEDFAKYLAASIKIKKAKLRFFKQVYILQWRR